MHEVDPKELRKKMEQRLQRLNEIEVEKMVQNRHGCNEAEAKNAQEHGIDFEATRRALRSKKTGARAKHLISQLCAGTYPLGRQLRKCGVKVLATCPFCKNGEDSLQHRLWCCPTLEQERQAWIPDDVQQWAKRGGKETLLANMC